METRLRYDDGRADTRSAVFLPYIHSFRAVAIVAVVASHLDLSWPPGSVTGRIVLATAQDASAMFLFVAGFLFQHLSHGFRYGKYLKTKLRYVVVPYVVVSVPALLYEFWRHTDIFGSGHPLHHPSPLVNAALALLTAEHMPAPMWFIPMISVLYAAAPLLIAIDRHPRLYWSIPPLMIVAMLCHRPLPVNHIGQALVYFGPAYLVGMWFSHYRERVMRFIEAHLVALFLVYAAIQIFDVVVLKWTGVVFSRHPFSTESGIVDVNLPSKLLLSFALVGLLARYQAVVGRKLDYLAGASFGVFFVHEYFLELFERVVFRLRHRDLEANLLNTLAILTLCTLASVIAVAIARAIAGKRSRYIVGC